MNRFQDSSRLVLNECAAALGRIDDAEVERFLDLLLSADQVFFIGVGRVKLSLEAMAKRFAHLGIRAVVVGEITEPAITPADLLVVGSGSGASLIPVAIAQKAKSLGARIAHIGSNPASPLRPITDAFVRIPVGNKFGCGDGVESRQPMTSLFEQSLLLFGDTLAGMIIERRGIDLKGLWQCHANLE